MQRRLAKSTFMRMIIDFAQMIAEQPTARDDIAKCCGRSRLIFRNGCRLRVIPADGGKFLPVCLPMSVSPFAAFSTGQARRIE